MEDHKLVWSDYAFEGKLVKVRVDTVEIPERGPREREIVEHPGAVAILPVLADGRIVLVRQFRPATGRTLLEVPAGTREPGEDAEECAHRELAEETGYRADSMRHLVSFFVSPGWCTEELVVYVAQDIAPGTDSPEDDEQIKVELIKPDQIPSLIQAGDIGDAKTMVALVTFFGIKLL
jgi:8-oxo-dGTP pyrophosphatase MutT (NUDIX family)